MKKWNSEHAIGVVIIIHGAGEHHGRYRWVIDKFNKERLHVVAGDLPGQGQTRGKRGHIDSFDQYIDTIYNWYKEAAEYDLPVFLYGHSMGGLIAIRSMMEKHMPMKGVILSSPCLGLYEYPGKMKEWATKLLHRVTPTWGGESGIRTEYVTRSPEIREAYRNDELRVTKVSYRWYQELIKAMRISLMEAERFPDVPLFTMVSGDDYVVDKYAAHRWFNQLTTSDRSLKEWKGLYHELLNEPERDLVFRYVMRFIHTRLEE